MDLHVLQISTYDLGGGAEKVAWNLFQNYLARGLQSQLMVGRKFSKYAAVIQISDHEKIQIQHKLRVRLSGKINSSNGRLGRSRAISKLFRILSNPKASLYRFLGVEDFEHPATWSILDIGRNRPDIIHCHNLHKDYFDLRILPWLSHQVPVVMTLHDAWLLSGHCAHSFDCERWKRGCGQCPDLSIDPPIRRDATAYNWRRKQKIYQQSRLYVATPSRWLMNKVEQSMLDPAIVEARVIPNGVDTRVFRPFDKAKTRHLLRLPQDSRILLFAANGIRQNRWKDFQTLRTAILQLAEKCSDQKIIFLALGEDAPVERLGKAEIRFIPFQTDLKIVARYYQAADIYIHASLADTFPNAVLEALACGTPVIATAVGGIPEQIEHGANGFLVPVRDAQAMVSHLWQLIHNDVLRRRMAAYAAEMARQKFDLARQVDAYLGWYEEILRRGDGKIQTDLCVEHEQL